MFQTTDAYAGSDDPEGDGLSNLEELQRGLHPGRTVPDRDADRLPDLWEERYFGSLAGGGDEDPDGDGLTNLDAYELGVPPVEQRSSARMLASTTASAAAAFDGSPAKIIGVLHDLVTPERLGETLIDRYMASYARPSDAEQDNSWGLSRRIATDELMTRSVGLAHRQADRPVNRGNGKDPVLDTGLSGGNDVRQATLPFGSRSLPEDDSIFSPDGTVVDRLWDQEVFEVELLDKLFALLDHRQQKE
jgi:hypothetical protein